MRRQRLGLLGLLGTLGPLGLLVRGLRGHCSLSGLSSLSGPSSLSGLSGLTALMVLLVLAACTGGDEAAGVPSETGTPIAFSAQQQEEKAVTRSTGLESVLTYFKVYGFKNTDGELSEYQMVFPGYTVNWVDNTAHTSTTNSHNWEYVNQQPIGELEQTIKYWDWSASAYRFFGVAGVTGTNEVTTAYKTYPTYKAYELTYDADADKEATIPYYAHLWYSDGNTSEGHKPFGQAVQLEFLKPFAKVRFMFTFEEFIDPTATYATATELTGKRFYPTNGNTIKMRGKVTVSYPLTGSSEEETFFVTPGAGGETALTQDYYVVKNNGVLYPYANASASASKEYTVLPATNQGSYTLTVNVNGEPKSTVVPAEYMNWLPGYQYTYIFKVHVDGSVEIDSVQSAFREWIDHTADHTVYNW